MPTFPPEFFKKVHPVNSLKAKQFQKGVAQLAQEGAIQVYHNEYNDVILGAVGVLQFEVFEYRLKNEYNSEIRMEDLDYSVARWVSPSVLKEIDFQKLSINLAKQKIILSKKDESLERKLEFMFYDDNFHRDLYAVAGKEEIWDIVMNNQYDYIRQRMFLNRYNLTHMEESVKQHDEIFSMLKERNLEKLIECNRRHLYTGVSEAYDFVKMAPDYFE